MIAAAVAGVWRSILSAGRGALSLSRQRLTEDRRLLEQTILPAYAARIDIGRVLFVGCAPYTRRYEGLFTGREYWTIDPVLRRRQYGSQRHLIDRLERLGEHVDPGYFDLIICNGVLGWGLNELNDAEAAFAACERHLRAGGELMLGWNDVPPRNRVTPDEVQSLQRFEKLVFEPFGAARRRVEVAHCHVFDFYRKPLEMA